ncbi:imidazole glycerol phosphate synthase cyclase subunit [Ferrovibrio terrae]|uniref:imidazole glycerol phosphate synthase subunit HisF n=1 Tax=Ferrovibrio terrae TaxID=2594003 RepID=UPI003137D071
MLKKRVTASIFVLQGQSVQSIGFNRFLPIGDPAIAAEFFSRWGADEIMLIDLSAPREKRGPDLALIERVSRACFVPLAVAGGLSTVEQVHDAVAAGADKVAVNTAALQDSSLISRIADRFGAQCAIAAFDVLSDVDRGPVVTSNAARERRPEEFLALLRRAEAAGAGEILVQSVDRDGSRNGYDLALIAAATQAVHVPVIALGGCGHPDHAVALFRQTKASAAAIGNMLNYTEHSILLIKAALARAGIPVRNDSYADYAMQALDMMGRPGRQPEAQLDDLFFRHIPDEVI